MELAAERDTIRASLNAEEESHASTREELEQEKAANKSLLADLQELRSRAESSLNYLTASLLAAFGVAIAAVGYSKCQEPEL